MGACEAAWDKFLTDEAQADRLAERGRVLMDRAWEKRLAALTKFREAVLNSEGEDGWRRWSKRYLYPKAKP